MFRFLHAGDLHLCSPLAAFSPRVAAKRRERQFVALEQLFAAALEKGAQMILLSGDVFDSPMPDRDGAARLFGILGEQPIPVVIAPGNHDHLQSGGVWERTDIPQNVYVFDRPTLGCFDFAPLGVAIYGYAFPAETMPAPELGRAANLLPDRISVLLAHGDLQSPLSPYAPISVAGLERSGFRYAALGHIHKPMPPRRCNGTVAAYSGFFAGRGFDEVGPGQALLVEIDGERVRTEVLLSAADRFACLTLDCTGAVSAEEIRKRVREMLAAAALPADTALRLCLEGSVGLDCRVEPAALLPLGASLALFEIKDQTVPILDAAYLEKDPSLRGAFYRALLPRLTCADEKTRTQAAYALRLGLAALSGREV